MENRSDDRCIRGGLTQGPPSPRTASAKTAGGITVYLLEELSDARMRCAQLKDLVAKATSLVESSPEKDHIFEVAAHLIHGIPDTLFRLDKALDAAAMSASRLDYEEIKQNLKPEKAEELEQVLQNARLRYLTHRSQQLASPKVATSEIERIASVAEQTGQVPVGDLLVLAAALETGVTKAASEATPTAAEQLRAIALAASTEKSRVGLAKAIRTFLANSLQPTAMQTMNALLQSASSREEVMDGFKESNPSLTDAQLKEIADHWEKNKNVVKDQHQASETTSVEMLSRFEEGKPADPTKDMSEEDAKKWREMTDEHKDVVKDMHKEAFMPDAPTADRVLLFVESIRDRLLIAQRSVKMGDWRHFKMSLRHITSDLSNIYSMLGLPSASSKLDLILRELVAFPLGSSGGQMPATPAMPMHMAMSQEASSAWATMGSSIQANSREEVMKGFKSQNPKLTDEQLNEIADHWEKNKDVVKDKHASKGDGDPIWDMVGYLTMFKEDANRSHNMDFVKKLAPGLRHKLAEGYTHVLKADEAYTDVARMLDHTSPMSSLGPVVHEEHLASSADPLTGAWSASTPAAPAVEAPATTVPAEDPLTGAWGAPKPSNG